eukprot:353504-Chlamydomonas_euryale.AAC.3
MGCRPVSALAAVEVPASWAAGEVPATGATLGGAGAAAAHGSSAGDCLELAGLLAVLGCDGGSRGGATAVAPRVLAFLQGWLLLLFGA